MDDDHSSQSDMNIPERLSGEFDGDAVPMQIVGSPPIPSFMSNIGNPGFMTGSQDVNGALGMSPSNPNVQVPIMHLLDSSETDCHVFLDAASSVERFGCRQCIAIMDGCFRAIVLSFRGPPGVWSFFWHPGAITFKSTRNIGADMQLRELVEETISGRSTLMHDGLVRGTEPRISSSSASNNANGRCLMLPRTEEEWNKIVETVCSKISMRPLSLSILEEIQQSMHVFGHAKMI
eukprot:752839-Hanusia_phi.AAC.4